MNRADLKYKIAAMYRDWYNNYVTVPVFASDNGLTFDKACKLLALGRKLHNKGY